MGGTRTGSAQNASAGQGLGSEMSVIGVAADREFAVGHFSL